MYHFDRPFASWYGQEWAMNLGMPDIHPRVYVLEFTYTHYFHDLTQGKKPSANVSKKLISAKCSVMNATFKMTTHQVYGYGSNKVLDTSRMELITANHIARFPQLLD